MTAQELLDRDGFIVYGHYQEQKIGAVLVCPMPSVVGKHPVVVVGTLTKAEAQEIARRNKMKLAEANFYYRAIAE